MFSYSHFLSVEINIHSHSFKKYIASINPENKTEQCRGNFVANASYFQLLIPNLALRVTRN